MILLNHFKKATFVFVILVVFGYGLRVHYAYGQDVSLNATTGPGDVTDQSTPTPPPVTGSSSVNNANPGEQCGDTGQKCCPNTGPFATAPGKCNNSSDAPSLVDANGNPVPNDYPSYGLGPSTCTCEQGWWVGALNKVTGASSDMMCNRYFAYDNYTKIVDPGLQKNAQRVLTKEVKDHIAGEHNACLACVGSAGIYTAIGCIPTDIESLIKTFVIVGLIVAGILALLCVIYAGIQIQLSRGDTTKVSKAQDRVRSCVYGILVIVFSAFVVNLFGGGLLGFSLLQPAKREILSDEDLSCRRECVYSELHGKQQLCFRGACPDGAKECGKPNGINEGCRFAPKCNNFEQVACPVPVPLPSPEPTPPNTGTPTPPPTTPGPTSQPTLGPVPGGETLVTRQMLNEAMAFHHDLWSACGSWHLSNYTDCLTRVNTDIPHRDIAKEQIRREMKALGNPDFQCVGYMKAMMSIFTGKKVLLWNNYAPKVKRNAANIPEPALVSFSEDPERLVYELTFIDKNSGPPLAGDFVKLRDGRDGHIGLIYEVINDNEFRVQHANYSGDGTISTDPFYRNDKEVAGYYRLTRITKP